MSKYSNEFKLQVIKYYLEELHSYQEYCKEFNIPSYTPIKNWLNVIKCMELKEYLNNNYQIMMEILSKTL